MPPTSTRNPAIARENARRGTRAWLLPTARRAAIGGYLSRASAAPREVLSLHVASAVPFDIEWYRLGWYRGLGARCVRVDRRLPAYRGPGPERDRTTGLAEAEWTPAVRLSIPADWPSGMYTAVLRPQSGPASYVPFIVRPVQERSRQSCS